MTPAEAISLARTVIVKYGVDADKPSVHLAKMLIDGAHVQDDLRCQIGLLRGQAAMANRRASRLAETIATWLEEHAGDYGLAGPALHEVANLIRVNWSAKALDADCCYCNQLGPLSLRSGDLCRACERKIASVSQ